MPKLEQIELSGFSLYALNPNPIVSVLDGVTCIVGANGLGKSTLLAAVSYGLTGHLANPEKDFQSLSKYIENSRRFSDIYFTGRIEEVDREAASVKLRLRCRSKTIELTRSIFDGSAITELSIVDHSSAEGGNLASDKAADELSSFYEEQLIEQIGLHSFEQFVYLQQELLSFDERRILIFWDERLMEQTMYLVFGFNAESADRAATLRKEAERQGSLGRNAQWQATQTLNLISSIDMQTGELAETANIEAKTLEEYQELLDRIQDRKGAVANLAQEIADKEANVGNLVARQVHLRDAYEREFADIFKRKDVWQYPASRSLIDIGCCLACGTTDPALQKMAIEAKEHSTCPICGSSAEGESPADEALLKLKGIDAEVGAVRQQLNVARSELERLRGELRRATEELSASDDERKSLEGEHSGIASYGPQESQIADLQRRRAGLADSADSFLRKRDKHYSDRDANMAELESLQTNLVRSFRDVEDRFIPLFRRLAEMFIGRSVSARLELRPQNRTMIILDLDGETRREHFQLSESQKYFIDIALRMALIQTMIEDESRPCFFVDTPEGSLDIAYESRAGEMLSDFAERCDLLMTANLNSSFLLKRIAQRCGNARLKIERMTEWATLSKVQQDGHELFEEAFKSIENAMEEDASE